MIWVKSGGICFTCMHLRKGKFQRINLFLGNPMIVLYFIMKHCEK